MRYCKPCAEDPDGFAVLPMYNPLHEVVHRTAGGVFWKVVWNTKGPSGFPSTPFTGGVRNNRIQFYRWLLFEPVEEEQEFFSQERFLILIESAKNGSVAVVVQFLVQILLNQLFFLNQFNFCIICLKKGLYLLRAW